MKIQYENLTIRQAEVADAKQFDAWRNDSAIIRITDVVFSPRFIAWGFFCFRSLLTKFTFLMC